MRQTQGSKRTGYSKSLWLRTFGLSVPVLAASILTPVTAFAQNNPFQRRGTEFIPIGASIDSARTGSVDPKQLQRQRDEQYLQISQEAELIERQNSLLRRVVRLVAPTVVHIEAIKEEPVTERVSTGVKTMRPENRKIEEAGSGVLVMINNNNYILTNRHVIHAASLQNIKVETDQGVSIKPTRIWEDASTDIAVIDVGRNNLPVAKLADSRMLEIGDFVFAVGSPFGLNHSVSYGIISAKGRRNLDLGSKAIVYQDFIQTDAAINPGNSGGPLMNLRGEVVGINTAIASNSGGNEGIGFSIPINLVMTVATQLVEKGELQKSYLGVSVERAFNSENNATDGMRPRGAFVKVIKPNSPAELAGLRYGDVILDFDGVSVENDEHLVQLVGVTPLGRPIDVILLRDGKQMRIPIELIPAPGVH